MTPTKEGVTETDGGAAAFPRYVRLTSIDPAANRFRVYALLRRRLRNG